MTSVNVAVEGSVAAPTEVDLRRVQRRTMGVLLITQVIGGVGVAIGISVGALLAAAMGGTGVSGFGQSALVIGAAVLVLPITRLMRRFGRRPGLVLSYSIGALGAVAVVTAASWRSLALLLVGLFLFGGGSAANYQARYSAVDLAAPARRARQLSFVVWATTLGAVAGPNLTALADSTVHRYGFATYSGPFVFSAIAFLSAAVVIGVLLRPDPLLVAMRLAARTDTDGAAASTGLRAAIREVRGSSSARLGIASVAVGHVVMIGVMAMTPVYIGESTHMGHADTLRVVGIVLSLHIAGMYALSPITGWATDRLGRRPVILTGIGLLLAACAFAGTAGENTVRLAVGLTLLGVGWSATMVAGSTLLSESVGVANRTAVQGLSDFVMGLAGASAGALGGLVMAWSSYPTLTVLAALATIPLAALTLRPVPAQVSESVANGS